MSAVLTNVRGPFEAIIASFGASLRPGRSTRKRLLLDTASHESSEVNLQLIFNLFPESDISYSESGFLV